MYVLIDSRSGGGKEILLIPRDQWVSADISASINHMKRGHSVPIVRR